MFRNQMKAENMTGLNQTFEFERKVTLEILKNAKYYENNT